MTDIYDLHKRAFPNVAAYVILHGSEKVATIAFKYPRDGSGRLYAYVHWIGVEMVRGFAGGYGYDKHSAAVRNAVFPKMRMTDDEAFHYLEQREFFAALSRDDGQYWNHRLERAGFTVMQAI